MNQARFATAVLVWAAISGCADAAPADMPAGSPEVDVYVGRMSGKDAFIGVVNDEGSIVAYACDGKEGHPQTMACWFQGEAAGASISLEGKDGDRLEATLGADAVVGRLTTEEGEVLEFEATPASPPAGLHGEPGWKGWVELPDGELRGPEPAPSGCVCNASAHKIYCPCAFPQSGWCTRCSNCCGY